MKLSLTIKKISVEINKKELKQSGHNRHQNFKYFKLKDFLPTLNELMLENEIGDLITVEYNKEAEQYEQVLYLMKGDEKNRYAIKLDHYDTPLSKNGSKTMQDVQYTGAINTYLVRYLYTNAFSISDGDVIDDLDNNDRPEPRKPYQPKENYTPPKNEDDMFEIGVQTAKDSIITRLDKKYGDIKGQVLKTLCIEYKVDSFSDIKISNKAELDKLTTSVKNTIEVIKLGGDI